MSPLHVEVYSPADERWTSLRKVLPAGPSGSMSDNKPDGGRDMYTFECAKNDLKSTICRLKFKTDTGVAKSRARRLLPTVKIIKKLRDGESYTIDMRINGDPESKKYRFTHRKEPSEKVITR